MIPAHLFPGEIVHEMIKCFLSNTNPQGILRRKEPAKAPKHLDTPAPDCIQPIEMQHLHYGKKSAHATDKNQQRPRERSKQPGEENWRPRANEVVGLGSGAPQGEALKARVCKSAIQPVAPAMSPVKELTENLLRSMGLSQHVRSREMVEQQTRVIARCGI